MTYKEIGEVLGVSKQAIHYHLKKAGKDGFLKKKCSHCKKKKINVRKIRKWNMICPECYEKLHRTRKYKWSSDNPSCIRCGTDKKPHQGEGLCSCCYSRNKWYTDPVYRKKKIKSSLGYYYRNIEKRKAQMAAYNELRKKNNYVTQK